MLLELHRDTTSTKTYLSLARSSTVNRSAMLMLDQVFTDLFHMWRVFEILMSLMFAL